MLSDRIFIGALVVSIIFHAFIFIKWPAIKNLPLLKPEENIELTYYPIKTRPVYSENIIEKPK